MRLKSIFFVLLTGFLLFTINTQAQSLSIDNVQNLKVSQLSDQQILQIWKQFQASGMSEADAMKLMAQKGISPTELLAFKQRLDLLQAGNKSSGTKAKPSADKTDTISRRKDSVKIIKPAPQKQTLIYGYDFFSNPGLKFEPNLRIATPKGYVLGPDDEVIVVLTGLNETTVTGKITPEGDLKIPYAGLVYLNGYTIDQAYGIIKSRMQKVYPALASGKTQLTVNLGNVRSIRVTIIGEVKQPGTYTLSSLSMLFNALYQSGGPTDKGSLRNIEIIRNNKVLRTVDFYTFLQKGLLDGNIRLEDQDVIRFPVYSKRVAISGEVKRPGLYELKSTETLADLVQYAGGFSDAAYKSMAKVVQMGEKEKDVRDVPSGLFDRYVPANADSVYFEPILNRYANRIFLQGAVYRPGIYELTPDLTLSQLIKKADGIREDAFLPKGYIKRITPDRQKALISFNLNDILSGSASDISLAREDSIVILSGTDLKDQLNVTVGGFVRFPGQFTYRKGMKVSDVIAMAGGFTNDAATHRVELSHLLKNESDTLANKLVSVITLDIDSNLNNTGSAVLLQPLDYIYVPRLVNYHPLGNVAVSGEVLFPGGYALQQRDETAIDLIGRAGGLTPYGSLEDAQIFRNGLRVNINLTAKNSLKSGAAVLMPGDSIVVPRVTPFVQVTGEVNNPQLVRYNSPNFRYYINATGGTTERATLKNAYIQYPNGLNKPVKRFLFLRNFPRVEPGSKIIVPEKSAIRFHLGIGEISAASSILTALITLIAVLHN